MSRRDTVAARIEELRKSIPPAAGRNSRLGYISKDDFAELVGAARTRVIAWTTGQSYPEERYRIRLAELSGGRWQPDDFDRDREEPTAAQLERLEGEVERLTQAQEEALRAHDLLLERLEAVERQLGSGEQPRARPSELASHEGPKRRGRAAR